MDEMWRQVYCKKTPCWFWHAINYKNGRKIVAFVLGTREHELYGLICSLNLNITHVYSDNNFAYHDVIPSDILKTGKDNIQKIERKHLIFRTRLKRLARKTICFSKSIHMHKVMFALIINVLEFGSQFF